MRSTSLPLLLACSVLLGGMTLISAQEKKGDAGFTPLFNGKDLNGWKFVVGGKDGEAGKTFTVKDGEVVISGKPAGYMLTDKSYKNYIIRFDWKYVRPEKLDDEETFRGNSGLLIHIQGLPPKGSWPVSIEIQGMNRDHGKLINVSGAKGGPYKFDAAALKKVRKPVGEWNTTEVTVKDGQMNVKVNGVEVDSGKTALTEGPIGLQSEGAEIHFKNIMVKPIP